MTRYSEALRGNDIGDFCDLIISRANAALPRVTGLSSPTEPVSRLGPSGFDPSRTKSTRSGGQANNLPPSNS